MQVKEGYGAIAQMEQTNGQIKEQMKEQIDIEALLSTGKRIQVYPKGTSMYPLFVPGRDAAWIAPVGKLSLKKGDVVLYRRPGGILVLHRICRCNREGFFMVGDNQTTIEGPLPESQIRGVLVGGIRKGREFSVKNPLYRLIFGGWLLLRPVRPVFWKLAAGIRHFVKCN